MKTLVFSDTHLGKFELKKYNFLKKIIKDHNRVIINGDFWDCWQTSADKFIKSRYSGLFPLLLERDAIYIHGNHDPEKFITDNQASMFSKKHFNKYNFTQSGISFHIEHGHFILKKYQNYLLDIYGKLTGERANFLNKGLGKIQEIIYYSAPKRSMSTRFGRRRNKIVKNLKKKDKFYVIGDTHTPEIDLENKFANTGFIMWGIGTYITVEKDKISLIYDRY